VVRKESVADLLAGYGQRRRVPPECGGVKLSRALSPLSQEGQLASWVSGNNTVFPDYFDAAHNGVERPEALLTIDD
jgi:hypothetical protein